jgi:hypothetical protein
MSKISLITVEQLSRIDRFEILNMVDKKVKGVLRIEFLDNYPTQVLLANYLRGTGDAKAHVLAATTTYFYPIALAKTKGGSHQEKQMALLDAIRGLENQKKYLIDYYRIHQGIEIAPDSFPQAIVTNTLSVPSAPQIPIDKDSDDDDEDDYQCQIGNPNALATLNF